LASDETARHETAKNGPGPVLTTLWLTGAVLCTAAAVWVVTSIDISPTIRPGWPEATARIERRLGTGELVLVHRAGLVVEAQALAGLPTACDPRSKNVKIERQRPDALWIVGEKKIGRKLRKFLNRYSKRGTISFDDVHLYHAWKPGRKKSKKSPKPGGRK
jgi:hypothetical protein